MDDITSLDDDACQRAGRPCSYLHRTLGHWPHIKQLQVGGAIDRPATQLMDGGRAKMATSNIPVPKLCIHYIVDKILNM